MIDDLQRGTSPIGRVGRSDTELLNGSRSPALPVDELNAIAGLYYDAVFNRITDLGGYQGIPLLA